MPRSNAKLEAIAGAPLFARLSRRELAEIAAIADEVDLPSGRTLMREGERGREFFVLLDGTVEVRKNGRKINELGPGDFVGEIALVSGAPRSATVTTTSPVRALVITRPAFRGLLDRSPRVQLRVLEALAERLAPATL